MGWGLVVHGGTQSRSRAGWLPPRQLTDPSSDGLPELGCGASQSRRGVGETRLRELEQRAPGTPTDTSQPALSRSTRGGQPGQSWVSLVCVCGIPAHRCRVGRTDSAFAAVGSPWRSVESSARF